MDYISQFNFKQYFWLSGKYISVGGTRKIKVSYCSDLQQLKLSPENGKNSQYLELHCTSGMIICVIFPDFFHLVKWNATREEKNYCQLPLYITPGNILN